MKHRARHVEQVKAYMAEFSAKRVASLDDYYIRGILAKSKHGLKREDFPPEMVELKRAVVIMKRLMKELKEGGCQNK